MSTNHVNVSKIQRSASYENLFDQSSANKLVRTMMMNICSIIIPDDPTEQFNYMILDEISLLNRDDILDTMN